DLRQLRADRVSHLVETLAWDEGATDRSALLPCLDGHLGDERRDEEVELRGAGTGIRSEDRAVQGVGFRVEADRSMGDRSISAELRCGVRRASEADRVLAAQLLEEPRDGA